MDKIEDEIAFMFNGTTFQYALPFNGKGSGSWRTRVTANFYKQLGNSNKDKLPVLSLWSSIRKQNSSIESETKRALPIVCAARVEPTMILLVADFDKLPMANLFFPSTFGFYSWAEYREHLNQSYSHIGVVLESPSGKAKIIFKVQIDNQINLDIALSVLEKIINPNDLPYLDLSLAANSQLFVNERMFHQIKSGVLESLPVINASELDITIPNPIKEKSKDTIDWKFFHGELPEEMILEGRGEVLLARYILGSSKRALDLIDLPQPFILSQGLIAGLEVVSQPALSYTIRSFIQRGWLDLVDGGYLPGFRAKQYRVAGALRQACDLVIKGLPANKKWDPPEEIEDGHWNEVLLQSVNHFKNENDWNAWFTSLPGSSARSRKRKNKYIWKAHIKWLNRMA